MGSDRRRSSVVGGVDGVLEWPRLHRWLAALMVGLAFGFLARTGRLDSAETAKRLATLQAELGRSHAALVAAERAATAAQAATVTVMQPVAVAPAPVTPAEADGRRRVPAPVAVARNAGRKPPAAAPSAGSAARAAARPEPSVALPAVDEAAPVEHDDGTAAAAGDAGADDAVDRGDDEARALSEADVRAFLDHFRHAFERLSAEELAVLFSEDATDNDHVGRLEIGRYYAATFANLQSARYVVPSVEIRVEGAEAQAVAPVTIAYSDATGRDWLVDGIAHWWIVQTADGMAISRLDHREH